MIGPEIEIGLDVRSSRWPRNSRSSLLLLSHVHDGAATAAILILAALGLLCPSLSIPLPLRSLTGRCPRLGRINHAVHDLWQRLRILLDHLADLGDVGREVGIAAYVLQ